MKSYDMVISILKEEYTFEPTNEIDVSTIYKWIKRHRLQQLVKPSLNKDEFELKRKINADVSKILETKEKILKFLLEMNDELSKEPPIFIKGLNAFLHTNNQATLREMQDIDIFSGELETLKNYLIKKGFKESNESCDKHEYCKLYNEQRNIFIELHSYFPVLYRRDKTINQPVPLGMHKITYIDLKENIFEKMTSEGKVVLLNKEMATLISCLHIYKGFAWEPFYQPTFRAEELMEVYFLSKDDFNKELFLNLCKKHFAIDAVLFVKSLLRTLFPQEQLFDFIPGESEPVYKLTNDVIGPWRRSSSPDFFRKVFTWSSLNFLFENGYNSITYGSYNLNDFDVKYYLNDESKELDAKMAIARKGNKLVFDFNVNVALENDDNIFIHFGWENVHLWLNKNSSLNRLFGYARYSIENTEKSYHVRIIFEDEVLNNVVEKKAFVVTYEHKEISQNVQIMIPIELNI